MKPGFIIFLTKLTTAFLFCFNFSTATAQDSAFWDKVHFGGSLGIGLGSGYTDINVAPGAIYRFNDYIALGAGVLGSYTYQKNYYSTLIYGASPIVLFNPLPEVQLSAELQQLRVNLKYDTDYHVATPGYATYSPEPRRDFWNTAVFFGAGYSSGNATVGVRYNILYHKEDMVYSSALMPFVRFYF